MYKDKLLGKYGITGDYRKKEDSDEDFEESEEESEESYQPKEDPMAKFKVTNPACIFLNRHEQYSRQICKNVLQ